MLLVTMASCTLAVSAADQNVVVVLDDSGSMNESMSVGRRVRKMDAAKQALLSVLEKVPDDAQVGVLALNSTLDGDHWIAPLGPVDRNTIRARIASVEASGGTPLGAAMKEAADALLEKRKTQIYGTYRLLIVTDGEAGDGKLVNMYLPVIKARALVTDVIGVDMRGDHSLATQVNTYRRADDPGTLTQAIADVFAETNDDSGDAGDSDYDLLSGLPDEVAAAALTSLAKIDNLPIGEEQSQGDAGRSATRSGGPPAGNRGTAPALPQRIPVPVQAGFARAFSC